MPAIKTITSPNKVLPYKLKAITNAYTAIASAKAADKSIGTKIFPADSGLRPIDSIAFAPIFPIAIAGAILPKAIVAAFAQNTKSIVLSLNPLRSI